MQPMEKALNPHLQSSALSAFTSKTKTFYNLAIFGLALLRFI